MTVDRQPEQSKGRQARAGSSAARLDCRALWALGGRIIWVAMVICWPFLRPLLVLDCLIRLFQAMYHWNTPGSHAGLVFLLHFLAFGALTYFVATHSLGKR